MLGNLAAGWLPADQGDVVALRRQSASDPATDTARSKYGDP